MANHERKMELQTRFSYLDFNLSKMPQPLNLLNSTYLEQACYHLKIDKKRLIRVYYLMQSQICKKIFSAVFWLFMIDLQNKKDQSKKVKRRLEDLLKQKLFLLLLKL